MKKLLLFCIFVTVAFASSVAISVMKPIQKSEPITLEADGIVNAANSVVITAKSSGIFKALVHDDAEVHKGEKIAQISNEPRANRLRLLQEKLRLEQRSLQAQTAKLANAKDMYKMGVGSKNSYLAQKVALEQLKETYQTTKNEYKTLRLEEQNAQIFAPNNGYVTNLLPQNSYVSYQTQLATLLTGKTMVKLFVDATYAKELKKGMKVKLLSSYANTQGTISAILNTSKNNLIQVSVKPQQNLPQNLQVNAVIILKNITGLRIPKSAIVLSNNHPAVYVIKNGVAHLTFVEVQKDMIDRVLIKNTLAKDAKIALKNAYMLHDGLEVNIK
jgi:RND family efflux transporter MFP subunit